MRDEIEKRLHRVKIALDKSDIICPISKNCDTATNCDRCNIFFKKCSIFNQNLKGNS